MPGTPLLLGLLLLASGLLTAALGSALSTGELSPAGASCARLALVALVVSQGALIAGWSVLGRTGWFGRALGVVLAVAISGQLLGRVLDPASHRLVPIWTVLLYGQSLAVAAVLATAAMTAVSLTLIHAMLGGRLTAASMAALAGIFCLASTALRGTGQFLGWPGSVAFCLAQSLWLVALLAVVRIAGFRLVGIRD